jgi:hypothetical protein
LERIRCKISTQYLLSFLQTVVDVTLKIADVSKLKHDKFSVLCLYLKERRYLFIELYQKSKIDYWVKFSVECNDVARTYVQRIFNCVYILGSRKLTIAMCVTSRDRKLFTLAYSHNGGQITKDYVTIIATNIQLQMNHIS